VGADRRFEQLIAQVVGFVEAPALGLDLPLDLRGTAFQERVWQALREIPVGSTASYAQIAQRIGAPRLRAVAQACGANSLAVAIPCHRVVRSNGELSGYRWGVGASVNCWRAKVRRTQSNPLTPSHCQRTKPSLVSE
jgi:AraC family transcriptional regulator of adaptative response/methylated-DNA-[protein]-cysteine methyltransferase